MISLKKRIKKILPDRFVYINQCIKIFPKYVWTLVKSCKHVISDVKFMDDETTVDKIIAQGMSLGRFGDGEFMWMAGEKLDSFQEYSEAFADDLKKAFQSTNDNLLIGIPYGIFDSKECNLYAKMHWKIIAQDFLSRLENYIDFDRIYCNASITRPYIDYKRYEFSEKAFNNLKRIWEGRDIVIVEGKKTKLGMGNDLFTNAISLKRIICPATNAYEKIEKIKDSIRKNVSKDVMILGALGPSASILAAQLSTEGYQFIDIGHVDIEYMWYLKKAILREPIEGKFVNESGEKNCSSFYDSDKEYIESIIDRII